MKLPEYVRVEIRKRVGEAARALKWDTLGTQERARQYEHWTADPEIGGVLLRYMDKGRIRVYLKDSVLKPLARGHLSDAERPLRALRIDRNEPVAAILEKPHGRIFQDGRVVCWGRADEWKHVLMALHERTFGQRGLRPYGAVLVAAAGRFHGAQTRAMIEDAAKKLGIGLVVWLDT